MSDLGAQLATARLVRFPRLLVALAVVQLPLIAAAVVVAILQRWSTLGMIAASYAAITLARFAFTRVRVPFAVHDRGIDGFAILFGGFTNQSGVTLFDIDVPEGPVVRALLRDHRERASSIDA